MRVFITGGTGLVGTRLIEKLRQRGDEVVLLSRQKNATAREGVRMVQGDPTTAGPSMDQVKECDAVINLVGENLFGRRWNADVKESLRRSRVESTRHVVEALKASPRRADGSPKVLVSASAIGIYGPHGDEELTESSPAADDFLGRLCREWEQTALAAESAGVRVVLVRIGVVLDARGGALEKMLPPFRMFAGGPVGSGRQQMSWIHHEDLVGLFLLALDRSELSGPINGTAPAPVTNRVFSTALGKALGRPSFMPAPAFMLRLMLGEVADVVTKGQRVLPRRAQEAGYSFRFADIDSALRDVLK